MYMIPLTLREGSVIKNKKTGYKWEVIKMNLIEKTLRICSIQINRPRTIPISSLHKNWTVVG